MTKKLMFLKSLIMVLVAVPAMPAAIQVNEENSGIQLTFEGNRAFTADRLQIAMELNGELSRSSDRVTTNDELERLLQIAMNGKHRRPRDQAITTDELEQGLERLRQFLMAEGYLHPRIGKPQIEKTRSGFAAKVAIEEGSLYCLGDVKVTGATVFSEEQIVQALEIKSGDPFKWKAISRWFGKLQEMYGDGYPNLNLIHHQKPKPAEPGRDEVTVDLTIDIQEGTGFVRVDLPPHSEQLSLPPSPFETFAAQPTATVVWSKTIGRLESPESVAIITALTVQDTTGSPSIMRGLRIDLTHRVEPNCDLIYVAWRIMCERANAAVYVEEARLEEVRDNLGRGAAELQPMVGVSAGTTGLIVCGYQFSNHGPFALAALFTRAIAELKEASR